MKKILIVGAGGFGRELLQWIRDINAVEPTWQVAGFLDDNLHALDGLDIGCSVVGTISGWKPQSDEVFALALGSPAAKRAVVASLQARGAAFATVIHPTALVSPYAVYGEGLIMFPFSKLSCQTTVGDHVTILSTQIGHDNVIGDFTVVSGGCNILRNVRLGADVFVAAGVCVAQDVVVGDGAYLGLGSVVVKDVAPHTKVFGCPARAVPF